MYLYLWLKNWLESEEGQDLVEYALIIALDRRLVAIAALSCCWAPSISWHLEQHHGSAWCRHCEADRHRHPMSVMG